MKTSVTLLCFFLIYAATASAAPVIKEMIGKWWIQITSESLSIKSEWVILPTGEIVVQDEFFRTPYIVSSDNQEKLPSAEGFFKVENVMRDSDWAYIRLEQDGKLQIQYFCSGICDLETTTYNGLENYVGLGIGVKQDITYVGCYLNEPDGPIFHGNVVHYDNPDILACHNLAIQNGNEYFGISQRGRECYADDPNPKPRYESHGTSYTCHGGVGSSRATTIFKIQRGALTDVEVKPEIVGKWWLSDGTILIINANGRVTEDGHWYNSMVLSASDRQTEFPTSQGWYMLPEFIYSSQRAYIRYHNGELEFSGCNTDRNQCNYHFTGVREDFRYVGCFQDAGQYSNGTPCEHVMLTRCILDCYLKAKEEKKGYFVLRRTECFTHDSSARQYHSEVLDATLTSGCYRGLGGRSGEVDVYRNPVHPCDKNNGGCKDKCERTDNTATCKCTQPGKVIGVDGKSCVHPCDNNNGGCEDECERTTNTATCKCTQTGKVVGVDGKSCVYQCPALHPYAYNGGRHCCRLPREKIYTPQGESCDGGPISLSSTCCQYDQHVECPIVPCVNHVLLQIHQCPAHHPYAYSGGLYCCKLPREKIASSYGEACDGGPISLSSRCCQNDEHIDCPAAHCINHV